MASKDPQGKRLARAKASKAEEALHLLDLAARRVEDLGIDAVSTALSGLRRDLRRIADSEAGKSGGHLEPREKYRGRSQHLAMEHGRGVVTMFIDESGKDHPSLDQPLFVLAGVAMDDEAISVYGNAVLALKKRFGLDPHVCIHAPQIEKGLEHFAFGGDTVRQQAFRTEVEHLIAASNFRLLGSIIRKDSLATVLQSGASFPNLPPGLYEMALTFVAERFVDTLHSDNELKPCGRLVFESIGNREDAVHQRAFADLLIHGSEFVSGGCFRGWLRPGCEFRTKRGSHPLELADLAARAMLTWARDGFSIGHPFLALWGPKVATRSEVERGKFGVKIFPDADLRDEILAIRKTVRDRRIVGEA